MEGDLRSFRIALTAERYVNPGPDGLDGLEVMAEAGWGVVQLPALDYPLELARSMLADVAEQAEEFSRHGYDVVLVGEAQGLAEALESVGMALPDAVLPTSRESLLEFLNGRPVPAAARISRGEGPP